MAQNTDINSTSDDGIYIPTSAEVNRVPASEGKQHAREHGNSRHPPTTITAAAATTAERASFTGGIRDFRDGGSLLLILSV